MMGRQVAKRERITAFRLKDYALRIIYSGKSTASRISPTCAIAWLPFTAILADLLLIRSRCCAC